MADDRGQGEENGFFLQVEGALIDKRSHANDAAQTLEETEAFDDAVAAAVDCASKRDDTLVVVTADHECAGFAIVGQGSFTNAEAAAPPGNVDSGNPANDSTPERDFDANELDPERSAGAISGSGSDDPTNFAPATFRTADDPEGVADGSEAASLWPSYLSGNRTGEDVPIHAYGPTSWQYSLEIDNTDIYDKTKSALVALAEG